jgi:hypothetical protein
MPRKEDIAMSDYDWRKDPMKIAGGIASDPNDTSRLDDAYAQIRAYQADVARLRSELSAKQREIDEALQLTECCSSLKQMAAMVIRGAKAEQELSDSLSKVRELVEAARLAEATTEEKVRRLVEALVDFRKAKAFLGADDYDNGPEVRGMFQHADAKADLALSEVEALIGKQEEK